jgi:hypothetical protein
MKLQSAEFSNTFYDNAGSGESASVVNEQDNQRLNSLIERAKTFTRTEAEGTSEANIETVRQVVGLKDGRLRTLFFFVFQPEQKPETHLPYDPSIMAEYRLAATEEAPEAVDGRIYLSRKHLDTSNSRYDEAKVLERFRLLEQALAEYQAALDSDSEPSS